ILQKFSNWTNAAIIADPYLVNNPKSFEYNLYQLIQSLLPPTLDRPFHLSFLTRISNLSKGKEIFQSVEEYLKGLGKNYPINLGIYLNATIHDRTIMTNYYRVHSGHSFEYFNQAGKVTKD